MDKYLFYTGTGKGTLIGVPARDLSYEEAKRFGITNLIASGLYIYNSTHAIPNEYRDDLLTMNKPVEEEIIEEKPKPRKRSKKERE